MVEEKIKKLFLIDAYALIYRAYFAFSKNPRMTSGGVDTSAIYGFFSTIIDVCNKESLTHLGVVFDTPKKTHRHVEYKEYKANRDAMPEGISSAIPYIKNILNALKIPVLFLDGFEADDVIGTLAKQASNKSFETYMMTPDKDFAQLVAENIFMYRPGIRGNPNQVWDVAKVCEKFDIMDVSQVIDFLGMVGDSVDNIPGISGVGPKTASKLLKKYGSMEGVYADIDNLEGRLKEKIVNSKKSAFLSKKLAKIITDAPIQLDEDSLQFIEPNWKELQEIFKELEFTTLYQRVRKLFKHTNEQLPTDKKQDSTQLNLFSVSLKETKNIVENAIKIDTIDLIKDLVKKLSIEDRLSFFFLYKESNLLGVSISSSTKNYYVLFQANLTAEVSLFHLQPLFQSKSIKKIYFNSKNIFQLLLKHNISFCNNFFDIVIAEYLINPENNKSLISIINRNNLETVNLDMLDMSLETDIICYLVESSRILLKIQEKQAVRLDSDNLMYLFINVEQPLVKVLLTMELNGVFVDKLALKNYSIYLTKEILLLQNSIYQLSNTTFNIASPKQLGDVLFDKMKLSDKPKKTKSGQFSTNENELIKLKKNHPIIDKILLYRTYQKLLSTYVNAIPSLIDPRDNRVHTTFNQTITNTGRLSSSSPNLQNIPIRKQAGKGVRRAFVSSNSNHLLMAADYSQIELRLIAELSDEENMIQAFLKDEDIHMSTASKVFKTDIHHVTQEMRSNAKVVNFGIIYGVSAFGLSEQTNLNRSEAADLIKAYFETYPKLKHFMDHQIAFAKQNGYVQTVLGRKRYLRNINSRNSFIRSHDERNAVNMPVQGSAADIIKLAMINIQKKFDVANLKSKMVLQVHDELVFDVHISEKEIVKETVINIMQTVYPTKVPLKVDVGFGQNWLEAH